ALGDGRIIRERGDRHQTVDTQLGLPECRLEKRGGVLQIRAELRGITSGVDLQEDGKLSADFGSGAPETFDQTWCVDTLNTIECRRGGTRLVRLQVSDEFPPQRSALSAKRTFFSTFLHAIFADPLQSVARGVVRGPGTMGFRDRKELHLVRRSARRGTGVRDRPPQIISTIYKLFERWLSGRHFNRLPAD